MTLLYSFHGGRQYVLQRECTVQSGYLFFFIYSYFWVSGDVSVSVIRGCVVLVLVAVTVAHIVLPLQQHLVCVGSDPSVNFGEWA